MATTVTAQDGEDYSFPAPINVQIQRELLGETFPEINTSLKKLDGLIKYRRDLELYRALRLEAFNANIDLICKQLILVERRVNTAFSKGDLSPNEKGNYNNRIANERSKCQVANYNGSQYYILYDTFLNLYKSETSSSRDALNSCYASDPCRLRQI